MAFHVDDQSYPWHGEYLRNTLPLNLPLNLGLRKILTHGICHHLLVGGFSPIPLKNDGVKVNWVCLKIGNTPKANGFADHYPVFKWLFHWEY